MPMPSSVVRRRVVGLREHRHAALEGRVEEVVDRVQLASGLLRVVAEADRARLPRHREVALLVVRNDSSGCRRGC